MAVKILDNMVKKVLSIPSSGIQLSSKSVDVASLYNPDQISSSPGTILNYQIEGYLVNSNGFVNISTLNPVLVKGLTLVEASSKIQNLLEQEKI